MKKLALLPLLLLSLAAHADEREWIPYKKLVEASKLDKFYAMPAVERDKLSIYLQLRFKNKAINPGSVSLTVLHSGERQPIPVSADGRFPLVPNQKWIKEEATTLLSVPPSEKAGFDYVILTPLPEGQQWPYAPLMSSIDQANNAIGKLAGAFSLFAPKIKSVVFRFNKPAQLKVAGTVFNSDAKNEIKLKPESKWLKENPLIVASERPLEAELEDE